MSIAQLIERLLFQLSTHDKNRPLIIGIDGLGGSEKQHCRKKLKSN